MAANLGKSFNDLIVWNRTDKTAALREALSNTNASVTTAASPADVVQQADVTFSMLSTPEVVRSVFHTGPGAAMEGVEEGKSIIDCSTLQVEDMVFTEKEVTKRGGRFLEAPVSGSKGPAEGGSLIFLCAGDRGVFDSDVATEGFRCMGKKAFFLGEVGNGTRMKVRFELKRTCCSEAFCLRVADVDFYIFGFLCLQLVINQLMGTMLAALGESIVLSEALELSVPDMLEIMYDKVLPHSFLEFLRTKFCPFVLTNCFLACHFNTDHSVL